MKTRLLSIVLLLSATLFAMSCSKDKGGEGEVINYNIGWGAFVYHPDDDTGTCGYGIALAAEAPASGLLDDEETAFTFDIPSELMGQTIDLSDIDLDYEDSSSWEWYLTIKYSGNYYATGEPLETPDGITGGSMKVSRQDATDNFTIDITMTLSNGKTVKIHYSGTLTETDDYDLLYID